MARKILRVGTRPPESTERLVHESGSKCNIKHRLVTPRNKGDSGTHQHGHMNYNSEPGVFFAP